MDGWIKIHRQISENLMWTSEPFSRGQAWIDLLLLAAHKKSFFYIRGNKVDVKRGQLAWSESKLSERWGWSRSKLRRFLIDLEKERQIEQHKGGVIQVITVVNYNKYQEKEPQTIQQKDDRKTTERPIQERKECKEEIINKIYGLYPGKCHSGRSTGKTSKNKEKIKKLLSDHSPDDLIELIHLYISDCRRTNTYIKNFGTFLNNLPEKPDLVSAPTKPILSA